jgi:hypothetical protein
VTGTNSLSWAKGSDVPVVVSITQTTTNLSAAASWEPALSLKLTNAPKTLDWTNRSEPARYFRAVSQ